MNQWEKRARLSEQEDPRRRQGVADHLVERLASQLPLLLGALSLLYAAAGAWHLLTALEGEGLGAVQNLGLFTLGVGAICGIGAWRTRGGNMAAERANVTAFTLTLTATAVSFGHIAVTQDPAHTAGFMLIIMTAAALFQDGWRLAVAWVVVTLAWAVGYAVAEPPVGVWPVWLMGMFAASLMGWLVSAQRIRAFWRMASLNLELQTQIGLDPLTGIANRRAFQERIEALWERLAGEGDGLALIMVDLDDFKNLNDTRGHVEGDAALRQMGGVLRMAVRSTEDLPARLGGEEFAVILPRTRAEHALLVAERIRDAVVYTKIPNPGTPHGGILSASLGVALARPVDGGKPSDLMDRADKALYSAKAGGRNMVVIVDGTAPSPPAHSVAVPERSGGGLTDEAPHPDVLPSGRTTLSTC